jgi:hypothetical protein
VDTLREAVELYNKEAKKRGKPIHPLPDDELDVPELNKTSTVVPGLKGINMMTRDGKFMAQVYQGSQGFRVGNYDTLDEAVKEQNAAGAAQLSEWVTRKITAEHRAVVKEMQRKRELIIAEKAKSRKKLAKLKPAPAITRHRPRPEPCREEGSATAREDSAEIRSRPAGERSDIGAQTYGRSSRGGTRHAPAPRRLSQRETPQGSSQRTPGHEQEPAGHSAAGYEHGGQERANDGMRVRESESDTTPRCEKDKIVHQPPF